MKLPTILQVFSYLCVSTLARSLSKPGCIDKCGNVTIPYPFGIGSKCSANPYFTITCQNSTTPFLTSIKLEAINISLLGIVVVKQPVLPVKCSSVLTTRSLPIPSLKRSPFTISAHYNSLVVLGCKNSVWLRANKTSTTGGCTAICDANSTESYCNGVNCCQTTIPPRLKELEYTYKTTEASNSSDNSFCGYVFPADKKWLEKDLRSYSGLLHDMSNPFDLEFGFAPLVLEWELGKLKGYSDGVCTYSDDYCLSHPDDLGRRYVHESEDCERRLRDDICRLRPSAHECNSSSTDTYYSYSKFYANLNYYSEHSYVSTTKYCSCADGYKGNPYLGFEACIDIDECSINSTSYHPCKDYETCTNMIGHYTCSYDQDYNAESGLKKQQIYGGSMIGTMIMIIIAWSSIKAIKKRINANRRRKFFKRNGGFLLQQQLSATNNGLEKTKLYSFDELTQATNHFNENRTLGRGGQGTVYKGMLADGRIVAVKKSKKVEEGDIEVFINEVVILSQVNHRNVVKLSGCCLETEVPLLVYEFIPNGTLFKHIHEPREDFSLTWGMRVRIAREIAGALAYLHSSASVPIYHRDIKSTNILLDEKYRAKISDFGTSRSVAIDQTHLTTRVLGTFGYFDPEYFQSSQFTDKSDVYSFGVVMVELLTGEKAISSVRLELEMSLATHFLHLMEENQLFDIVDARVLKEGKREEVVAMAELARRCLHLNGKRRPTMKEVAVALDGIHVTCEGLSFMQNLDHSIEEVETSHFSSISGSMHLQPLFGEP